ncbi:MAG: PD40 domain-containing protein [Chloroflexi bacterium]|nr:PD40 domain-containing protein [Chloroflexota bacterium]
MKNPPRQRSSATWFLLVAAAAVVAVSTACGDGDGSATTSVTPTPPPDVRSPLGDSTVTATPPPPPSEYRLVYSEFGNEADTIWLVNPVNPSEREKIVTIPHRATFGINPSLSPDGRLVAYLSQPETAPADPFLSRADLMVLDLTSGHTEKILENVDITITPLWAPDGRLLYVRQKSGANPFSADIIITQITIADLPPPGETPSPSPTSSPTPTGSPGPVATPFNPVKEILRENVSRVLSFIPVGFADDDESLYFVQIAGGTGGQTLLGAYAPATTESIATATALIEATATAVSGQSPTPSPDRSAGSTPSPTPGARLVLQLVDQLISGPQLSPDRTLLSFLAPMLVEGDVVERVLIADIVNRAVAPLPLEGLPSGGQLGPVWHPDGQRLAIGFNRSSDTAGAVALVPVTGGSLTFLPAPTSGFDEPLSWSPDGGFLAVLHHSEGGQGRLDLVAPTGQRGTVQDGPDVRILGWFKPDQVPIPPSVNGE